MDIHEKINIRLKKMLQYVDRLKKFQEVTKAEILEDMDKRSIIERNLHLASEAVIDIANILNSEYKLAPASDNKKLIITLGEAGILEKKYAEDLSGLAPFRNVLVHDYLEVDYEIIINVLNNKLDNFYKFAKIIAEFLQKKRIA